MQTNNSSIDVNEEARQDGLNRLRTRNNSLQTLSPAKALYDQAADQVVDQVADQDADLEKIIAVLPLMPVTSKIDILNCPGTLEAHPMWLTAMVKGDYFTDIFQRAGNLNGELDVRFIVGEEPSIAALVWSLTTWTKPAVIPENYDNPMAGKDEMGYSLAKYSRQPPEIKLAFSQIVSEFLRVSAEKGPHREMELFNSPNLEQDPSVFWHSQAALLMCAACAGGDAVSARALFKAFPDVTRNMVHSKLARFKSNAASISITPIWMAAKFNQFELLESLRSDGWEPSEKILTGKRKVLYEDGDATAGRDQLVGLNFFEFAKVSDDVASQFRRFEALVFKFFTKHFLSKPEASGFKDSDVLEFVGKAVTGQSTQTICHVMLFSGMFRHFGNELIKSAALEDDADIVKAMLPSVHWPDHIGKELPLFKPSGSQDGRSLALAMAKDCVAKGHLDILLSPGMSGGGDKEKVSVSHHFAKAGHAGMISFLVEQGLDPNTKSIAKGQTLIEVAQQFNRHEVANFLRSHEAKKMALAAADEIKSSASNSSFSSLKRAT